MRSRSPVTPALSAAVLAAEGSPFLLEPVAHDADAAILAFRRQRVDRTFEAVEGMGGTVHAHLERLVVIVSAGFTSGHGDLAPVAWSLKDNPAPYAGSSGGNPISKAAEYREFRGNWGK